MPWSKMSDEMEQAGSCGSGCDGRQSKLHQRSRCADPCVADSRWLGFARLCGWVSDCWLLLCVLSGESAVLCMLLCCLRSLCVCVWWALCVWVSLTIRFSLLLFRFFFLVNPTWSDSRIRLGVIRSGKNPKFFWIGVGSRRGNMPTPKTNGEITTFGG